MPAAVPDYVKDFSEAPPGHRFNLYYAGWDNGWRKLKSGIVSTLDKLLKLPDHSVKLLNAFCLRQKTAAETLGEKIMVFPYISTAPFATGLGNEHPLENGFAFLNPYGLPYLAGSGIKGIIRTAAEELASGEWGNTHGWNEEIILSLFGPGEEDSTRVAHPKQGALRFWDVLPIMIKNEMSVEIMTPHHSEYYQGKHSPHNSESPVPIPFLAVPANSKFTFFVECNATFLHDDRLSQNWRSLLETAFDHAGKWLGFGAKTAGGYGRMKLDKQAIQEEKQRIQEKAEANELARIEAKRTAMLEAMTPNLRKIEELRSEIEGKLRVGKLKISDAFWGNRIRKTATDALDGGDWSLEEKSALADMLEEWAGKLMQLDKKDLRKALKLSALRGLA